VFEVAVQCKDVAEGNELY